MQSEIVRTPKWRRILVILAGLQLQIVHGILNTFGNLNPYITSYMRYAGSAPTLTYTESSWMFSTSLIFQTLAMPFTGLIERKLGVRWASLLAYWSASLGFFMSYFSIQHSFGAIVFTFGVLASFGAGIGYSLPLTCAMASMPENQGLANGLVNAGIGIGGVIFNIAETAFINPQNKKVSQEVDGERYFEQRDVLDKVPCLFLLFGGVIAVAQTAGSLLLRSPRTKQYNLYVGEAETAKKTENLSLVEDNVKTPLLRSQENQNQNIPSLKEDDGYDMLPSQAFKTLDFYLLTGIMMLGTLGIVFINTFYKAYGLSFINDDVFLTSVGTISAFFNSFGRLFWGFFSDKTSIRVASMTMCTVFTVLMLTLQVSELTGNKYVFMVYVCLLMVTGSGVYVLVPTAIAKRFGRKHFVTILGFTNLSQTITSILIAGLSDSLQVKIGWTGLLFVISGLYSVGLILAFLFNAKDKNGQEI